MTSLGSGTQRQGPPHPATDRQPTAATIDGAAAVLIPLSGKHGIGQDAIIDAGDWAWIERRYGAKWVLNVTPNDPRGRIVSGRAEAAGAAQQKARAPLASLARIVAGAEPGDRVFIMNGNTLDLRYDNLAAISGETIAAFMANLHAPSGAEAVEVG